MKKGNGHELRAGLFVAVGLLVLTGAIFMLGSKNALFVRTMTLFVHFKDINGLVVGAPVRLAGLDVGTVAAISFPADLHDKEARVRLAVRNTYRDRLRTDSRAFIDSSGLLGDKIINISVGDPSKPQLADGATLATGETLSFEAVSTLLHEAITSIKGVTDEARSVLTGLRGDHVAEDLSRITSSFADILEQVKSGNGPAHRLIYDERAGEELSAMVTDARGVAEKANRAMGRIEGVMAEIEKGDGSLHKLVYEKDVANAVAQLGAAAGEIESVVREVRDGHGLVHALIYDRGQADVVRELGEMSVTLNRMVQEIDKGRGTLGALVKDPSVYEDLKTLLGNIQRNVLFKALVRFTIEEEGLRRAEEAPRVIEPAP